jgi:hypothetical protein
LGATRGRIRDPILITKIVSVYGQAKFLNDGLNFNHARGQVWANLDVARKGADTAAGDQLANLERELSLIRAGIGSQTLLFSESLRSLLQTFEMLRPVAEDQGVRTPCSAMAPSG